MGQSTVFQCPHCKTSLRVGSLGPSQGRGAWQAGRSYALGSPPAGSEYSRETPNADLSGFEAGVKTPLAQAGITGTAAAMLAVLAVVWRGWHWATVPTTWVIVTVLAWWGLLLNTRGLLKTIETVIGKDLDGDGEIGFTVEITDLSDGKKKMSYARFPAKPEQVKRFALAALNDRLTVHGNHRLTRGVFERLRDEAVARGLCAWKNPEAHTRGVELTRAGEHVFKRLLDEGPD